MNLFRLSASVLSVFVVSCSGSSQHLKELGSTDLKELSALEYLPESKTLWGLEDSGNKNKIYKLGKDGKTISTVTISNLKNTDWEEMASDSQGNLYIGDFGNNDNTRKDLAIYKVDKNQLSGKTAAVSDKIAFSYPEQTEFPPKKSKMMFDCEAFFEFKGNFYLFTKNRSAKFVGNFYIYKVPNKPGNHKAQLLGELTTCKNFNRCAVTAADISPDGKKAVLLTGDKVFVITGFGSGNFANGKMEMHELGFVSQKEGLCFIDNDTLLIADEKDKHAGGKLYQLKLSALKAK
ncbi:MAG: hypothetical protein DI539_18635 [Flavobacterium psychrophilum]|nr:MAG: hypothetical protein DI539_18635 [Flavobacterium psychrophilum]